MSDLLISEILIIATLFPVVLRSAFIRSHRVDSVVLFSPVAFIVSIILWFVYGVSFSILCVTVLAFVILLSNFRALLRYFNKLFVDYYSIKFRIANIIEGGALIFLAIVLFIFSPLPVQNHSVQVFTGSCSRGFTEKMGFFQSANLILTKFEATAPTDLPVILYIPQVYSSTYDASPRLQALSEHGYTVICAEVFTEDVTLFGNYLDGRVFRPFAARLKCPKDDFSEESAVEQKAVYNLVSSLYSTVYFYEPNVKEETPLMEDFYLMRPLEAWLSDTEKYYAIRAKAECVPMMVVLDVNKKMEELQLIQQN